MIVCSCNVLSDHAVRGCLAGPECPRTPAQVYRCLGCSPQCGRCAVTIRKILESAAAAAGHQGCCDDACTVDCAAAVRMDRLADQLEAARVEQPVAAI